MGVRCHETIARVRPGQTSTDSRLVAFQDPASAQTCQRGRQPLQGPRRVPSGRDTLSGRGAGHVQKPTRGTPVTALFHDDRLSLDSDSD